MSSPDEHIDRGIKYKQLILFWDYYGVVVLLHVWLKPMECRLYQKYFLPYVNLYIKYIKHFALWIKLLNFSIKVIVHN